MVPLIIHRFLMIHIHWPNDSILCASCDIVKPIHSKFFKFLKSIKPLYKTKQNYLFFQRHDRVRLSSMKAGSEIG